jgi:predicted enzyme related to lactoylglutathione lyase
MATVGWPGAVGVAYPGSRSAQAGALCSGELSLPLAKGCAGTIFLETDDVRRSYEHLSKQGVEFSEPPEERPYGINSAFRDPPGNSIRLT